MLDKYKIKEKITINPPANLNISKEDIVVIGSELYPIPDNSYYIGWDNTEKINNKQLIEEIDNLDLNLGDCYNNTHKIVKLGDKLNLNIEYFTGWLFPGTYLPVHHTLAVIKNESFFQVIDYAEREIRLKVMKKLEEKYNEVTREKFIEERKKMVKNKKNSEKTTLGKFPEGIFFFGGKDYRLSAEMTFRKLQYRFPNHPAYKDENMNMKDHTNLQKELRKND